MNKQRPQQVPPKYSMTDIAAPDHSVIVGWSNDETVLWVNVDGMCVLHICRIPLLVIEGEQLCEHEKKS